MELEGDRGKRVSILYSEAKARERNREGSPNRQYGRIEKEKEL